MTVEGWALASSVPAITPVRSDWCSTFAQGMGDVSRTASVLERTGQPLGQPDLLVDAAQEHGAEIRRRCPTVKAAEPGSNFHFEIS